MPPRPILSRLVWAALMGCLFVLWGCGDPGPLDDPAPGAQTRADDRPDPQASAQGTSPDPAAERTASRKKEAAKRAPRPPGERPLPGFEGPTLAGTRLSMSSLIGQRTVLFFFNPEVPGAESVADAVAEVSTQGASHNFKVVGIGIGSTTSKVRGFARKHGFGFPVIDDSRGTISSLLRIPGPLVILSADAEGYLNFAQPGFDTSQPDATSKIADRLRESLRIPADTETAGPLVDYPTAPHFETQFIGGAPFDFASMAGRPVVLMFFLHTCPHCHHALEFFRDQLAKIPEAKRPALVAVSLQNRPSEVRAAMATAGLDFFESLVDPGQEVSQLYGLQGGVPDISMIDAEGRIIYRSQGWRDKRDPSLMRMYLARIAGERIPMLLSKKGYTGNDACAVCHATQNAAWGLTQHAQAYDTLVTHGEERDGECVSCHVVGFGEPGGFALESPKSHLENVGCENCHGRGGPHLSPDFLAEGGYAAACAQCHDNKHSLGFDFGTFLPNVSHAAIAALSPEARAARFADGGFQRELLPTTADYVGSDACETCHKAEFTTWSQSPHAHALASLAAKAKTADGACLACHTTGYGLDGGFPDEGDANAHVDLARVGCESCHGPGGDHVADTGPKRGSILSLGDKCDSCVILQICGSCHDEANDPDFTFAVQEHIDRQRHGTIEAGTGKPLGQSALHRAGTRPGEMAWVGDALARLGEEAVSHPGQ